MDELGGPRVFTLPDLGEGLTEAVLLKWRVMVGDVVNVDEPIVELESAKAVVDLPCPYFGVVETVHAPEGALVEVGSPLITVREPSGAIPSQLGPDGAEQRALVGFGPPAPEIRPGLAPLALAPLAPSVSSAPRAPAVAGPGAADAPRVISPVVRRLARAARVDLAAVVPTGVGGVVRRADVEWVIRAGTGGPDVAAPAPTRTPAPKQLPAADPGLVRVPIAGRHRAMAERMARSRREIPEATAWRDVDATGFLLARQAINRRNPERPVSVLGLLARFCVAGLKRHPELNATVDAERNEIIRFPYIHLGFAIAAEAGLVVPVVRNAETMTASQLSASVRALTDRARDGAPRASEVTGGTFTINNHGALGTDGASPIINFPEVAQLAVGRMLERPWAVGGQLAVRTVTQLTVTFDHRVCDGRPVSGFLDFLASCVEEPVAMLDEL